MLDMNNKVNNTIKRYDMLQKGDKVLLAVSGGADSMALAFFMNSIKNEYDLQLKVAHIEHGIRGEESVSDMNFVESWCKDNEIQFECLRIDAVNEAKLSSMGVEEYSRKRRYEYFDSFHFDKIATAHTLSDNIETVFFRLSRGTSLKGVCGIPPIRANIIRPLIDCTREDIENYCLENKINYVTDSTNNTDDYKRNYIRHNIVPAFKELNPSFEVAFSRFIDNAKLENELLDSYARDAISRSLCDEKLNLFSLIELDEAIYKRVIHKYFNVVFNVYLDDLHISQLYEICKNTGKVQINDKITAIASNKELRVIKAVKKVDFSKTIITSNVEHCEEIVNKSNIFNKKIDFYCDYDKIKGTVFVRCRQEGDKIQIANRHISKSLKKLFNEFSIPVEERINVPVVCDDNGIIGIVGFAVAERVKVDSKTKNIYQMNLGYNYE